MKGSRLNFRKYIINCINTEGYQYSGTSDKDKIKFLYDTFKLEYGHEIHRKGEYNALVSWLSGLPSSIDIPFYYSDIIKTLTELGIINESCSEKKIDSYLDTWFCRVATILTSSFRKLK